MSYFKNGDYVKGPMAVESEGYVIEVMENYLSHWPKHPVEIVQVRTNQGGLYTTPGASITLITPTPEERAREILGEDYL